MASILAAVGSELLSNLVGSGLDQIDSDKPKSFFDIVEDTLSDPINLIPFGQLIKGAFEGPNVKGNGRRSLVKG